MNFDAATVATFALVMVRVGAWAVVIPILSSRGMNRVGGLALSLALAVFLTPQIGPTTIAESGFAVLAVLVLAQVVVGILLGWATALLFSAFEAAGAFVDLLSGLSIGAVFDPVSGNQSAVFARIANMTFIAIVFQSGGYQDLVAGLVRSFDAVPLAEWPTVNLSIEEVARVTSMLVLSALQIAAPVLGALMLTEAALAVAARFAPQANVFLVGLPLKILVTLTTVGSMLVFFPRYAEQLIDLGIRIGAASL